MNKKIVLRDGFSMSDKSSMFSRTDVTFYVQGTNEVLWHGSNRSVLTGSPFVAYNQFDITSPSFDVRVNVPNYDRFEIKDNPNSETGDGIFELEISEGNSDINNSKCYLWCIGKGGTVSAPSQLIANDFASWIWPEDLIPFRVIKAGNSTSEDFDNKYFGRRSFAGAVPYTAYYFKKITAAEFNIRRNGDGNKLTDTSTLRSNLDSIYRSKRNLSIDNTDNLGYRYYETHEIEAYVELRLQITVDELREWFMITDNDLVNPDKTPLNNAHVDSLSLCMATPVTDNEGKVIDYKNITPFTKLNFYEEKLGDLDKGIDIVYQLYY